MPLNGSSLEVNKISKFSSDGLCFRSKRSNVLCNKWCFLSSHKTFTVELIFMSLWLKWERASLTQLVREGFYKHTCGGDFSLSLIRSNTNCWYKLILKILILMIISYFQCYDEFLFWVWISFYLKVLKIFL